ncbi:hypothetical protein OH77DRAFT_1447220 [Trametes cingulata]|nr:hypothetical protein OH77DRAFT_1447220 [Trametes cingulata]
MAQLSAGTWFNQLDALAFRLDLHKAAPPAEHREDEEKHDKELFKTLRFICDVVRDAEKAQSPELPAVIERAQALLNDALNWAYEGAYHHHLPSFADSPETPLVEDSFKMCGSDITEAFMLFYTKYMYPGARRPKLPDFAKTPSWQTSPRPHPYTTRLSRFRAGVPSPATDATPLAQLIYQGRAQLTTGSISAPLAMELSSGGSILAMSCGGGWKGRDPVLRYYVLDELSDDFLSDVEMEPGLSNVARHIATDEDRKLVFLADADRVKSFSWAPNPKGKVPKRLPNVHTMNSLRDFDGPLAALPNGRLARAGKGQAALWTLDTLDTHQDRPGQLIGPGKLNTDDSWRTAGDPRIEMSSGSAPGAVVAFADMPQYAPTTLHWHAPSGLLLCGERAYDSRTYECVAIDLEHGGKRAVRYLGHGQDVDHITSSPGDPNVFVTAGSDGFARMFDVRRPLPVLTFNSGEKSEPCADVVFVHPDGIPTLFTGGERTEQVKVWDVRGKSVVYELSTGNTAVVSMAWDAKRASLFVATEHRRSHRMGEHRGYRKARIPRWATWKAVKEEVQAMKEGKGTGAAVNAEANASGSAASPKPEGSQAAQEPKQETQEAGAAEQPQPAVAAQGSGAPLSQASGQGDAGRPGDKGKAPASAEDEMEEGSGDDEDMDDYYDDDEDADEDPEMGEGEDEESDEEDKESIDEEYSADKRWPTSAYHNENFYGYTYDAAESILMRWQYKAEPDLLQLPPTIDAEQLYVYTL